MKSLKVTAVLRDTWLQVNISLNQEIIKKTGHGKEVDMWSIGVLTFFLLSGYLPFESESNLREIERVLTGDYSFSEYIWTNVSLNGNQLLMQQRNLSKHYW